MSITLKDVADVATSLGAILGIPLVLYGIDAWRREAMWKRRSELCEEVLALCYETKEIIGYMRSSGGFGGDPSVSAFPLGLRDKTKRPGRGKVIRLFAPSS